MASTSPYQPTPSADDESLRFFPVDVVRVHGLTPSPTPSSWPSNNYYRAHRRRAQSTAGFSSHAIITQAMDPIPLVPLHGRPSIILPSHRAEKRDSTVKPRPYTCTVFACGKSFTQQSHLKIHSRAHTPADTRCDVTLVSRRPGTNHPASSNTYKNLKGGESSSRNLPLPNGLTTRAFSSGKEEWYVEGYAEHIPLEGLADNGADVSFISPELATRLGLTPDTEEQYSIALPNGRKISSPGVVELPWVFKGESTSSTISCWIFPGLIHDLVLGKPFLSFSETLTKFTRRIKSRLKALSRLRLMLIGHEQQRLYGLLNGQPTLALPDTGSDIMLVSRNYAQTNGLSVDWAEENHLEVEYADGSTDWTSGVARDVQWTVGNSTIMCDFHVLDDLCVDVVLSNDYLYYAQVFSTHAEHLVELESEEDRIFFCTIRLLNNTLGQSDNSEMVDDVISPNAFTIDQEWAFRDRIRDQISALPEDQQPAARQAETERRRKWEEDRKEHQLRWKSLLQTPVSSGQIPSTQSTSSAGVSAHEPPTPSAQREKWRKRIRIPFLRKA